MKNLFLLLLLCGCAQSGQNFSATELVTPLRYPSGTAEPTFKCAVYDACSYTSGINSRPIYDCTMKTYQAADHAEIPVEAFQGSTCLTTKEDFQQMQGICQVAPGVFVQCPQTVQGPGPLAIPSLNI